MALYIDGYTTDGDKRSLSWHVGEPTPTVSNVWLITADCDELEHIRRIFPALTPHLRIAVFPKPFAQLIYANLGG